MACLKCGRETDQMFCDGCRESMEKYPIKPGAFIFHPREHKAVTKWSPVRLPNAALEKKVKKQEQQIRRLAIAVIILMVLLTVVGSGMVMLLKERDTRPLGQNYTAITNPTTEATAAPTAVTEEETVSDPMFHVKH